MSAGHTLPAVVTLNETHEILQLNASYAVMCALNLTGACENQSLSTEEWLMRRLGPRYKSVTEASLLTVVYALIFVTGVVGNVCTCTVIMRNHYMHTATNYYLFTLAISDVLTLILGLPPEAYSIWEAYPWIFGEPFCIFKTFVSEMTSSASILTITAFTVERYVAICHPFKAQTMSCLSRAIKLIILIWIVACLSALPYPLLTRVSYYVNDPVTGEPIPESLMCNIPDAWMTHIKYVFQFTTFLLFIAPMTVITVLYIMIGVKLRRSGLARRTTDKHNQSPVASASGHSPVQSRRAVLKMLVAVVIAFFLCWAPFHAQRLLTTYIQVWTNTLIQIQNVLFYISGVLYFVSSTVNPILYNLMSRKYRQAFKETLCRCCLSDDERLNLRNGRRGYYSERSGTLTTTTSRANTIPREKGVSTRLLSDKVAVESDSDSGHKNQNGRTGHWGSWRDKFIARHSKSDCERDRNSKTKTVYHERESYNGKFCDKKNRRKPPKIVLVSADGTEMTDMSVSAPEDTPQRRLILKTRKKCGRGTFV